MAADRDAYILHHLIIDLPDNDIYVEVLRYLTDADLEKIGVSLGHRRKLLAILIFAAHGR